MVKTKKIALMLMLITLTGCGMSDNTKEAEKNDKEKTAEQTEDSKDSTDTTVNEETNNDATAEETNNDATTEETNNDGTLAEYNGTLDDTERDQICRSALESIKNQEGFTSTETSGVGFAAFINQENTIFVKISDIGAQLAGGSGTAGFYQSVNGVVSEADGSGLETSGDQCAYGRF